MKDKRVKGCANPSCQNAKKKVEFKADQNYCPICGSGLVLVCAKCQGPLDDEGPKHKTCDGCEAAKNDRKAKIANGAKKIGGAVIGIAPVVAGVILKKK